MARLVKVIPKNSQNFWRPFKYVVLFVLVLSLLALACCAGSPPAKSPQGLELVEEAWEIILKEYVSAGELDQHKLAQGAIRGMVQALGDPFSAYLTAEQYELSKSELQGEFEGIGAVITLKDDELTVVAPIKGSPADRAGIRPGDKILEIDGESTKGLSLVEAALKIRGKEGTRVKLLILHQGEKEPQLLDIIRAKIKLDSVFVEPLGDGLFKVQITHFSNRTGGELRSALEQLRSQGVKGLVLDLRNNPGGMLDAAIEVASQFLSEGLVTYAEDGRGNRITWEVSPGGLALDIPLVVLVNGASASASEIVAGALQDHHRAILIGIKTLGKGSVNKVYELGDGSALYLTFAYWFTPSGRQISDKGIAPDIVVERTPEEVEKGLDPQLERAVEQLRGVAMSLPGGCRIPQPVVL